MKLVFEANRNMRVKQTDASSVLSDDLFEKIISDPVIVTKRNSIVDFLLTSHFVNIDPLREGRPHTFSGEKKSVKFERNLSREVSPEDHTRQFRE